LGVGIYCYGIGSLVLFTDFSRLGFLLPSTIMVLGAGSWSWILEGWGFYSHQMLWYLAHGCWACVVLFGSYLVGDVHCQRKLPLWVVFLVTWVLVAMQGAGGGVGFLQ
jgi:hypothetical protein